jgi:hypothetical protein
VGLSLDTSNLYKGSHDDSIKIWSISSKLLLLAIFGKDSPQQEL